MLTVGEQYKIMALILVKSPLFYYYPTQQSI
jgi:hypothetical protein